MSLMLTLKNGSSKNDSLMVVVTDLASCFSNAAAAILIALDAVFVSPNSMFLKVCLLTNHCLR